MASETTELLSCNKFYPIGRSNDIMKTKPNASRFLSRLAFRLYRIKNKVSCTYHVTCIWNIRKCKFIFLKIILMQGYFIQWLRFAVAVQSAVHRNMMFVNRDRCLPKSCTHFASVQSSATFSASFPRKFCMNFEEKIMNVFPFKLISSSSFAVAISIMTVYFLAANAYFSSVPKWYGSWIPDFFSVLSPQLLFLMSRFTTVIFCPPLGEAGRGGKVTQRAQRVDEVKCHDYLRLIHGQRQAMGRNFVSRRHVFCHTTG